MAYDFSHLKEQIKGTEEWLQKEYSTIRTSGATPAFLDSVMVESYGSMMPLNQIATIAMDDARTLRVTPWDHGNIKAVEKAIRDADLGVSIATDEKGTRVFFPQLTGERREALGKLLKEKLEGARVTLRGERERVWSDIQEKEKEGEISEDDKFRYKDEMQKLINDMNKKLDAMLQRKEKEIMGN